MSLLLFSRQCPVRRAIALSVLMAAVVSTAATAGPKSSPLPVMKGDARSAEPEFRIVAPSDGAFLPVGKVLVIGRLPDLSGGRVDLYVDGRAAGRAVVDRNAFSGTVALSPGKNVVSARAGKAEASITVTVGDKATYIYHPNTDKCSGCHLQGDKGYDVSGANDSICYRCHKRKDKRKFVHGPMGGGDCVACHDAHGASNKALTVTSTEKLCVTCHDQKSSEKHFNTAKGKPCIQCHDSHASDKPFLQK